MNGEDENQRLGNKEENNSISDAPMKKRFSSEHTDEEDNDLGDTDHLIKKAKLEGIKPKQLLFIFHIYLSTILQKTKKKP
jgi:hypothetical protein